MEMIDAIKSLQSVQGKGLNKLQAEHFNFVNVQVLSYLLCINAALTLEH